MTSEPVKVTELIKEKKFTYSFEVTPDLNKEDIIHLNADPAFFSVTWHAQSHKCKDLNIAPLKIAEFLRSQNKQVLMHLSCDMMRKQYLDSVLAFLQEKGICNLFLMLGESFNPTSSDFKNTLELMKYVREISGQYFCVGIAGFCECDNGKFREIKEKIDAGADFIITQAFFEAKIYNDFVTKCEEAEINVPILPGIFPFENEKQLTSFMNICKVKVSNNILDNLKMNEDSEIAGAGAGAAELIRRLIQSICVEYPSSHFHFFTLNKIYNVWRIIKEF